MIHFVDHRLFERQLAPRLEFRRFGLLALAALMGQIVRQQGLLCRLQGLQDAQSLLAIPCTLLKAAFQYDLIGELLDDARIVDRAMSIIIVMSDPKRTLDTTAAIPERHDQFLVNRRQDVLEPGECTYR